jgi:hypothetical protein
VGWILHQHRQAYELYGTEHSELHQSAEGRRVTAAIQAWDDALLRDFRRLFANSMTVAARLKTYNGVAAEPLYHPPPNHERLHCGETGRYVLYPGRFDQLKRQHLIVEAMRGGPRTCASCSSGREAPAGSRSAGRSSRRAWPIASGPRPRVGGGIRLYAGCLAVYSGVFDEDYGYVTLEALLSASRSSPTATREARSSS